MSEIKTIIELFDDCQLENVVAALALNPEKIVFVGFKKMMSNNKMNALKRFFEMKGMAVTLEYQVVGRYDFDAILSTLNRIIDTSSECVFDLTGGREMVLAAMGEVALNREIPMVQFDVKLGKLIPVKNCGNLSVLPEPSMLISECIALNGGVVFEGEDSFKWELNSEFVRDVEVMWQICKENCARWNKQSVILELLEHMGRIDESLCVKVDIKWAKEKRGDIYIDEEVMGQLVASRLITGYDLDEEVLTFKYKNEQVHRCITKAGNILEIYALLLLKEITKATPGFYDDIDMGVTVDWDGELHNGSTAELDTRNEIDIILMRGLVPIFVSCKNGEVHKEALYELSTVADKFGGKYAKKILLSTYICHDPESRRYILQRAKDMGIEVIDGVDCGDRERFLKVLRDKVK